MLSFLPQTQKKQTLDYVIIITLSWCFILGDGGRVGEAEQTAVRPSVSMN